MDFVERSYICRHSPGGRGGPSIAVSPLQYLGAAGALFLAVGMVVTIIRQKTTRTFQKNALLVSVLLLVFAIFSNALITLVVIPTLSMDQAASADAIVLAKRIQATFDFLFAIVIGVFIVVTTQPEIMSGRDFRKYLIDEFPNAFTFYLFIMFVSLYTVLTVEATARFPAWPETSPVIISFPEHFFVIIGLGNLTYLAYTPYKLLTYLQRRHPSHAIVRNTYLIIVGVMGYGISEMMFEVVLPSFNLDLRGPGFLLEVLLVGLVAIAIRQKQFLHELSDPEAEAHLETAPIYEPERGFTYLVLGESSDAAYEVFRDLVTHGYQGLCITRRPPKMVMERYGLEKTPILWLSRVANQKNCVRPSPPENIALAVEHFVTLGQNSVVLLDGLEYLVSHNDFLSVLALLHDLNENVSLQESILLIPLDPSAVADRELALVRRDLRVIGPDAEPGSVTRVSPLAVPGRAGARDRRE